MFLVRPFYDILPFFPKPPSLYLPGVSITTSFIPPNTPAMTKASEKEEFLKSSRAEVFAFRNL